MEVDCILRNKKLFTKSSIVLILVVMEVDCIQQGKSYLVCHTRLNPCCDGSRLYILTINMLL